ncbi:MAG: hypothetical protein ABSA58_15175 [Acetobacteraceae bacterium]
MRRIVLVSMTMTLSGCGYSTWWNPPFSSGSNPHLPLTTSVNMERVLGSGVAVTPLTTEPGDIWPGPLAPPKTLQDLEQESPASMQPVAPSRGSPLSRGINPLLAPVPNGTPGSTPETPNPPTDRRIIVPNGNGTSTVIYPDGRIETIPTPK